MKVGVIFDRLDPSRGGAEACLDRVLRELIHRGHEVVVYARASDSGPWKTRTGAPSSWRRGEHERAHATWAEATARSEGCDVVFGVRHVTDVDVYQPHGGTWAATVEGKDRAREPGPIARVWRRCSGRHRVFSRADEEVFARRPPPITLAVSEGVRADILRRFGHHHPQVRVVWPGVEPPDDDEGSRARGQEFRRRHAPGTGSVILFVAHQFRLKGLGPALAALRGLGRPEARLLVLGRGPAAPFRSRARRLGIEDQVCFLGARHSVWDALAAADVLLHPTFYDPCALVSLEARSVGVPVVTTRFDGAAPLLEGRGAVVEDPRDERALALALAEALELGGLPRPETPDLRWSTHVDAVERALSEAAR